MGRGRSGGRSSRSFGRSHRRFGREVSEEDDVEAMLQGRTVDEAIKEYLNNTRSQDDWCRWFSKEYERTVTCHGKDSVHAVGYKEKLLASCPERYLNILKDDYVFPKKYNDLKIPEGRTFDEALHEYLEKSTHEWCRLYVDEYKWTSRRFGKDNVLTVDCKEKLIASCPEKYLKILSDFDDFKRSK